MKFSNFFSFEKKVSLLMESEGNRVDVERARKVGWVGGELK